MNPRESEDLENILAAINIPYTDFSPDVLCDLASEKSFGVVVVRNINVLINKIIQAGFVRPEDPDDKEASCDYNTHFVVDMLRKFEPFISAWIETRKALEDVREGMGNYASPGPLLAIPFYKTSYATIFLTWLKELETKLQRFININIIV